MLVIRILYIGTLCTVRTPRCPDTRTNDRRLFVHHPFVPIHPTTNLWEFARLLRDLRRRTNGSNTMHQTMELQRCRWLQKLSKMSDKWGPRKILGAWCPHARPTGKPWQTIRQHGYAKTLKTLGFESTLLVEWMNLAKDEKRWAERIEWKLELAPGSYKPKRRKQPGNPPRLK
jgi:hypothetical protein